MEETARDDGEIGTDHCVVLPDPHSGTEGRIQ